MPLIVTPKQLSQRAELYHQLAGLTTAGIGLTKALEVLERSPPSRSLRRPLHRISVQLAEGATFSEALRKVPGWLPSFDIALLQAGEQSGRLDACFKLLAVYYNERAQLVRSVIQDLLYPVFLFHFAVFISPFPNLFVTGNVAMYLRQTVGALALPYTLSFLLIWACQGRHGEMWRSLVERISHWIPILGTARRSLALARLSAALEALINAGVSIIEAWDLAASASGSPAVRRAVLMGKPRVLAGETPAEMVSSNPVFPELFANLYHTGEISGQLDGTLQRLHVYYQEEGTRKLKLLAQWIPKFIYLCIMLRVASMIFKFYTGYFDQINKAIDF